jgi:4-aminobutyrate aminotransferase-like enzyme
VLTGLLNKGVVISSSSHVVRITPPLCLDREQADFLVVALEATLNDLASAR